MKQIFLLSKLNLNLSKEEVLQLFKIKSYELIDNLLIIDNKIKLYDRLAYTKAIYQLLFISNKKEIKKRIKSFNWNKIYKKNYCVRFNGTTNYNESEFADLIYRKLRNPKTNLEKPETLIELFFIKNKVIATKLIWKNKERFEKRKPHLRPELSPTSLDPRLARCLINLTGIKKGIILDPFCGTGGLLIEAGLSKLKPIGYDIDKITFKKCKINLDYYNIKDYKLYNKDSLTIKKKYDYIVTDLPYGQSSKKDKQLYSNFLRILKKILKKRGVIVFPNKVNKRLLRKFKIIKEFKYYLHKNLTKNIILLK